MRAVSCAFSAVRDVVGGELVGRAQVDQAVIRATFDDPRGQLGRLDVVDLLLDHQRQFARVELHERPAVGLREQRQRTERQRNGGELLVQRQLRQSHGSLLNRRSISVAPQKPTTAITTTANTTRPQGSSNTSGSVTWPIAFAFTKPWIAGYTSA